MTDPIETTPLNSRAGAESPTIQYQSPPTIAPPGAAAVPGTIGGYEILGELGRGGMGVVYKARQKGLERLVALKMILHAEHAGDEARRRFLLEAQSLARLTHENIVRIHEVGEHEGKPFLSLEYVDGGGLDRHLAGTPLAPTPAAELVRTLALAMQYAHAQGIVHRDLKPANVLLAACGLALPAVPKITDFGLARTSDSGATRTGAVMGTPSYMPPEQAAGLTHAIDARSDVYSLGAILYECLTGRPPFRAATPMDTMLQVMHQEPVSVRTLQPSTPRDLETICHRALQKEPTKRYRSAAELADDLGRFLRGEPVRARPVGAFERGRRWCRRNPVVASLVAAVALLLIVGTTVSTVLALDAVASAEEAGRREKDALEAEEKEREARKEADAASRKADERAKGEKEQRLRTESVLYGDQLDKAQRLWKEGNAVAAREKLDATDPELRDWEFRYLDRLFHVQGRQTLFGHFDEVKGVAFSPDGSRIASVSMDETLRLWDVRTGNELRSIKLPGQNFTWVGFTPDGARLIVAGGSVIVRDAKTLDEIAAIAIGVGPTPRFSLSADGGRLAWNVNNSIRVLDLKKEQELFTTPDTDVTFATAFSPDGTLLVGTLKDGTIRLYDGTTGAARRVLGSHPGGANDIGFDPEGRRLATAGKDEIVRIWDVRTGRETFALRGHVGPVVRVLFGPDGLQVVSVGEDRVIRLWDVRTGREIRSLRGHGGAARDIAFHPDGRLIVSASADGTVMTWNIAEDQDTVLLSGSRPHVAAIRFDATGRELLVGAGEGNGSNLDVWDIDTRRKRLALSIPVADLSTLSMDREGRIATGFVDTPVRFHDVRTGETIPGHEQLTQPRDTALFSPDGRLFASICADGAVRVRDFALGKLLHRLPPVGMYHAIRFSPDGKRLAAAGGGGGGPEGTLHLWEVETGREVWTIKENLSVLTCIDFSPDGRTIAAAGFDRIVYTWDVGTGNEVKRFAGHTNTIHGVAFHPGGRRLASAGQEGIVRIWDIRTGQEVFTLPGRPGESCRVIFSPDGHRLASAWRDPTVRIWEAHPVPERLNLRRTSEVANFSIAEDASSIGVTDVLNRTNYWDLASGKPLAELPRTNHIPGHRLSKDGKRVVLPDGKTVRVHFAAQLREENSREATRRGAIDAALHETQAAAAEKTGDWFAAAFHLERVLRERPLDASLHVRRAFSLSQGTSRIPPVSHYLQAILIDPTCALHPTSFNARKQGDDAADRGDWDTAAVMFRLASRQGGSGADEMVACLLARTAAGRREEFSRELAEVMPRALAEPLGEIAHKIPIVVQFGRCTESEAKQFVQVTSKLLAAQRSPGMLAFHGAALHRAGRHAEAVRILEEVKDTGPETLCLLALASRALGRTVEAKQVLEQAEAILMKLPPSGWEETNRRRLVVEEARRALDSMPRAED